MYKTPTHQRHNGYFSPVPTSLPSFHCPCHPIGRSFVTLQPPKSFTRLAQSSNTRRSLSVSFLLARTKHPVSRRGTPPRLIPPLLSRLRNRPNHLPVLRLPPKTRILRVCPPCIPKASPRHPRSPPQSPPRDLLQPRILRAVSQSPARGARSSLG